MAKKPESDSFIDLFAQVGRDLKMPSIDIDRIIEHHRKNLETLEKTARAATAGAEVLRHVGHLAQRLLEDLALLGHH